MFLRKIDKIFKELPNVFGIANDILVVGYKTDGKDHDKELWRVLQICREANLKLNKDKLSFQVYISHILWWNHIMAWSKPRPTED